MWQRLVINHIYGPFGSYNLLNGIDIDGATPTSSAQIAIMKVDQYSCNVGKKVLKVKYFLIRTQKIGVQSHSVEI